MLKVPSKRPEGHTQLRNNNRLRPFLFVFLPFFCFFGDVVFSEYFCTITIYLCMMESTSYVFSFRVVLFYLVITGWIFDISLFVSEFNQSIQNQCMCPESHTQLPDNCLRPFFFFFLFWFLGEVAFSEYICTNTFSPFRVMFFYLVTTGWIYDISLFV